MTPEESLGQLFSLGKTCCGLGVRLEANPSTIVLKVQKSPDLWPEKSARTGTPVVMQAQIRQVGRSRALTFAKGPARRLGWDDRGGDACLGPPWGRNTPNGLDAEISAQLPRLGKLSHRWMAYPYNLESV